MTTFNAADIIVLAIVAIVLLVYRQLDKNNRSLEKVRKYADKVRAELDKLTKEKKTEIHDLNIDIEVQEKTNREILKRIQTANSEALQRSEDLETLRDQLDKASGRLTDLDELTQNVDENLQRVQKESEYVDSVGLRLNELMVRAEDLGTNMEDMVGVFRKENAGGLQSLKEAFGKDMNEAFLHFREDFQGLDKKLGSFKSTLSELVNQRDQVASEKMQDFTDKLAAVENAFNVRIEKSSQEALALESDVFTELKELLSEHKNSLQRSWETDSQDLTHKIEDTTANLEDSMTALREDVDKTSSYLNDRMEKASQEALALESNVFSEMKELFFEHKDSLQRSWETDSQDLTHKIEDTTANLEDRMTALREEVDKTSSYLNDRMEKASQDALALESNVFSEMKELFSEHKDSLQRNWAVESQDLTHKIEDTKTNLEGHMTALREDMDNMSSSLSQSSGEQDRMLASMKEELEGMLQSFNSSRTKMTRLKEETDQDLEKMTTRLAAHKSDIETRLTEFSTTFTGQIEDTAESLQLESLKAIEKKLKEYEEGFFPRFERLEQFMDDMDTLEGALRRTMEEVRSGVLEDFGNFDRRMQDLRSDEQKETEERAEKLRQAMAELEKGLDDLKSRAYDNVSEQLQVFEDDFFEDLKKRDNTLQSHLKEWQDNLVVQITEMADQQTRDRNEVERSYSAEMTKRLGEVQSKIYQQLEQFQGRVDAFRDALESGMSEGREMVQSYQSNLSGEVVQLKDESIGYMTDILEKMKSNLQDRLDQTRTDFGENIDSLYTELEQNKKDLQSLSETVHSDAAAWQSRVLQQIKDQEAGIAEQYDDFKESVSGRIQEIQDDFKSQKEELILSTNEERADLKQELASISEKVYQLQSDLKDKTSQTLDKFNSDYNLFLLEFQKKMRDSHTDAELKIREMRQGASDAREKMEAFQKKLFAKIEEDSRFLTDNLDEISKKQQDFIAQTHVFERADQLKDALTKDLMDLKNEIQRVEGNMDRLREYQNGYEQVQGQYREVLDQINRFMDEKKKVDELEEKIGRMVNLSKSVDLKLDQITSLHEMLQQYQVRVKELEDQHHAIDSRFARIESKAKLVDQTADNVEHYTSVLSEFEQTLASIKEQLDPLSSRMEGIESRDKVLMANRELTDEIYDKISSLSQVLNELDSRTEKIDKAREWIARTETRMDGVIKQAQDQVKLIGRLAERDGRPETARTSGSPDMDTRETVLRLARLGWKTEDIARTLKLSRGEVELILEITPKS